MIAIPIVIAILCIYWLMFNDPRITADGHEDKDGFHYD